MLLDFTVYNEIEAFTTDNVDGGKVLETEGTLYMCVTCSSLGLPGNRGYIVHVCYMQFIRVAWKQRVHCTCVLHAVH